jgi:Matrixin/Fibronectin type III domain
MMRRLQLAAMTAVILLGLGMVARHVNAYTTNGHAWGVKQVPYYINPQNLYVSESSALAAITSAAAAWRGIANIELVYAGNTNGSTLANNGKNEVFFRDDASSHIAETYWWYDGTGHLVDADIVLHENNRFYSANIGCNGDGFYIENTGAHEFGHVLGLAHSSVDTASMWPTSGACETIRETPDPDDIAGLVSLYPGSSSPAPTAPPNAPSGLAAGVSAANPTSSLVLAWVDNATDETGYRVERSPNGSSFSQIAQLGSGATSYVDNGLASGSTFYYRVSAYNNGGASGYSNVASSQTQAAPAPAPSAPSLPSAPAGPSPANGATNVNLNVTLSWTASNATQYDVYFKGALVASNLTTTSYRIGSLPDATQYSWQVVAKNAAGSTSGPTWSFTTKVAPGKKK